MDPNFDGSCDICTPSYYCQNAQRYGCSTGTWSDLGFSNCKTLPECPIGFYCTDSNIKKYVQKVIIVHLV